MDETKSTSVLRNVPTDKNMKLFHIDCCKELWNDDAEEISLLEDEESSAVDVSAYDKAHRDCLTPNGQHMLNTPWVLSYIKMPSRKVNAAEWHKLIRFIAEMNTIEEYFGIYNALPPPSIVDVGSAYSLFRHNIPPVWELDIVKTLLVFSLASVDTMQEYECGCAMNKLWSFFTMGCIGDNMWQAYYVPNVTPTSQSTSARYDRSTNAECTRLLAKLNPESRSALIATPSTPICGIVFNIKRHSSVEVWLTDKAIANTIAEYIAKQMVRSIKSSFQIDLVVRIEDKK